MASDDDDISLMSGDSEGEVEESGAPGPKAAAPGAAVGGKDKDPLAMIDQATLWAEVRAHSAAPGGPGGEAPPRLAARRARPALESRRSPAARRPGRWTRTSWSAWR